MGIADADSAEHGAPTANYVIAPVACAFPNRPPGAPRRFGQAAIRIPPGSLLHRLYGRDTAQEEFFCNYEFNRDYEQRLEASGMTVAARGERGEPLAVELPGHRFFLAMLFQPPLSSRPETPHPVVMGYLQAAAEFARGNAYAQAKTS